MKSAVSLIDSSTLQTLLILSTLKKGTILVIEAFYASVAHNTPITSAEGNVPASWTGTTLSANGKRARARSLAQSRA